MLKKEKPALPIGFEKFYDFFLTIPIEDSTKYGSLTLYICVVTVAL